MSSATSSTPPSPVATGPHSWRKRSANTSTAAPSRGDVVDYTLGSRRIRVLVVSANAYTRNYPVTVLIHSRADGDVPGILLPLPSDLAGGGTIDLSRIRFADPGAFGH